jgi:hypothetical protein
VCFLSAELCSEGCPEGCVIHSVVEVCSSVLDDREVRSDGSGRRPLINWTFDLTVVKINTENQSHKGLSCNLDIEEEDG